MGSKGGRGVMKGESDGREREWSGGGREWSGGGREWSGMMEGVVWCDGELSLVDEGWSSMVGVAGWALLSVGVVGDGLSGRCRNARTRMHDRDG